MNTFIRVICLESFGDLVTKGQVYLAEDLFSGAYVVIANDGSARCFNKSRFKEQDLN